MNNENRKTLKAFINLVWMNAKILTIVFGDETFPDDATENVGRILLYLCHPNM